MSDEVALKPLSHLVDARLHTIPEYIFLAENVLDGVGTTALCVLIEAGATKKHIVLPAIEFGLFVGILITGLQDKTFAALENGRLFWTALKQILSSVLLL